MKNEKIYTEADLISFGEFLLREIRILLIITNEKDDVIANEKVHHINDFDLENWKSEYFDFSKKIMEDC